MSKILDSIIPKRITSSTTVTTANKSGVLFDITLIGGTTASSLKMRNGGSNGSILWEISLAAQTNVGDSIVSKSFSVPLVFSTDIYATLAGTGAVAYIAYKETG